MDMYVILRRSGWRTPAELEQASERSLRIGDEEMPDAVRWIRSYVLDESDGLLGTLCIYEAASAAALRKHASLADIPADEIVHITETVLIRPDPVLAA
jgi:hypothetical protein